MKCWGLLLALVVAAAGVSPAAAPVEAQPQQGPLTGLLLTLAATGEETQGVSGPAGLELQITLENRTGRDATGIRVRAPIPSRTRVVESWIGRKGQSAGTLQGQTLGWDNLALKNTERLGPLTYRIVPDATADGAIAFRDAAIQPEATWSGPQAGTAARSTLRLNGLWGESGLRRTVLPSGLTVFTRDRPDTSTVSIRIAVRAASRDEDDTTSGGSHWLEHAHFLGTATRDEVDAEIDAVGGISNASTGWEATDYWHLVPAEHFDLALDVLADQMLHSTFRAEAFDRERRVVFEELKRRNDSPSIRAFDEFINTVFRVSPLRRHPAGTIESVQAIPISTILAYRDRFYVTGNMAVAAAGNLRHDDAVAKIERAFAGLPRGPQSVRPRTPEPSQAEPRVQMVEVGRGDRVAEINLGWPVPGDDHADSAPLAILEDILGTTGQRLAEEIKDRRAMATSVDVGYIAFSDAGVLMLEATTQPDRADAVVELLLNEIRRLRDGDVSEQDVRASLRAIAGRRSLEEEPNQRQTSRAQAEVSGMLESWDEYMARLRAVTPADVQRVARRYLDLQNYTLVIVRA